MTQEKRDAIRARCEAATPGEWRTPPTFSGICSRKGDILAINRIVNTRDADMIFICYAREDIPALLDENEELRTSIAAKDAEIARLTAALDTEKKRAEALERALRKTEQNLHKRSLCGLMCDTCVHHQCSRLTEPCNRCYYTHMPSEEYPDYWQFDEPRYTAKG